MANDQASPGAPAAEFANGIHFGGGNCFEQGRDRQSMNSFIRGGLANGGDACVLTGRLLDRVLAGDAAEDHALGEERPVLVDVREG